MCPDAAAPIPVRYNGATGAQKYSTYVFRLNDTVHSRLHDPLDAAFRASGTTRSCPGFSDDKFLKAGVGRVIDEATTGRAWVQKLQHLLSSCLSVSNFFKALGSERRLKLLGEVAEHVRLQLDHLVGAHDPLAPHIELDDFGIYASDGHYEAHATHAPKVGDKPLVPGALYAINLRSHSLRFLDVTRPKRKKEHEVNTLARLGSTALRMGEPVGRKVILVYDKAAIHYMQWHKWKAKGLYMISCEKSNSAAQIVDIRSFDATDPRNVGIVSDELVGVACGTLLRRVHYRDPAASDRSDCTAGSPALVARKIFSDKLATRWNPSCRRYVSRSSGDGPCGTRQQPVINRASVKMWAILIIFLSPNIIFVKSTRSVSTF